MKKPLVLCILDGYGYNPDSHGNAIKAAKTPVMDELVRRWPVTYIGASGMDVGLPDGQMGNSEVGHTNIGAGRVVYQELTRITKSIDDGDFFENAALVGAIESARKSGGALHLLGLMSDGGVHSHNTHCWAILKLCKKLGFDNVYIHCFLDGRDVAPTSGADFVAECVQKTKEIGVGRVATVMGRYYAMDRDNRWERVKMAYDAMVYGKGGFCDDPVKAIKESYTQKDADGKYLTDEFVLPTVCVKGAGIKSGDSIIFYNFRPDRARQITRAFSDAEFKGFEREFLNVHFVTMTQYDALMPNVTVAFMAQSLKNTLGEYLSQHGLKQLRIAETEKYAHVTFFFNGGVEKVSEGEERILVPSPKVATYDLKPEMSAPEVCDKVVDAINSGRFDVIILNFANCDMVGHTGVFEAAVKAVETVDSCTARVADAVLGQGGVLLVTADHGNADKMLDDGDKPFTAHTTNPVPFITVGLERPLKKSGGKLCDIAPTMLEILGLEKPAEMTGVSLLD